METTVMASSSGQPLFPPTGLPQGFSLGPLPYEIFWLDLNNKRFGHLFPSTG